jgi:hypothetical protein
MDYALARQVDSLGDLMEGWFDDGVEPYSGAALSWVAHVLDHQVAAFKVPVPYVYPTAQGFVRAGWVTPRWDVIADIDLTTHAVAVFACKVTTHEVHERRLQLESPGAESQLGRFVAGHTK